MFPEKNGEGGEKRISQVKLSLLNIKGSETLKEEDLSMGHKRTLWGRKPKVRRKALLSRIVPRWKILISEKKRVI